MMYCNDHPVAATLLEAFRRRVRKDVMMYCNDHPVAVILSAAKNLTRTLNSSLRSE